MRDKNRIINEDIARIVKECESLLALKGHSVLITGATGLIGSLLAKSLLAFGDINVYCLIRDMDKAKAVFGDFSEDENLTFLTGDVSKLCDMDVSPDYIIHGASPTSSKYFVTNPVETIGVAMDGARAVMELARKASVRSVVFLSSLEVYGVPNVSDGVVGEADYGYIDCTSIRSSYSEGKRMVECLCAGYAAEYGVPVKIARLSQTFGPGVNYDDGRVFMEFARCAMEGKNIVLNTSGETVRTYCYTTDAINAIITILIKGKTGEAYNVSNMRTDISIADMARLVCELFPEKNIEVEFNLPKDIASFGYNPQMVIKLDTTKLSALGWSAKIMLPQMFTRLIESFRNA